MQDLLDHYKAVRQRITGEPQRRIPVAAYRRPVVALPAPPQAPLAPPPPDLLEGLVAPPRIKAIIREVLVAHNMTWAEIVSPARTWNYTAPRRHLWKALQEAGLSLPQIGRLFKRDHTTILHGIRELAKHG